MESELSLVWKISIITLALLIVSISECIEAEVKQQDEYQIPKHIQGMTT